MSNFRLLLEPFQTVAPGRRRAQGAEAYAGALAFAGDDQSLICRAADRLLFLPFEEAVARS